MGYFIEEAYQEDWMRFIQRVNGVATFVVTEENIRHVKTVPVHVKLPETWKDCAEYILEMDFIILGEHIKKGYVSDGASVPRYLWSIYPPVGRYLLAAFGHDHMLDRGAGWKASNAFFDRTLRATGILDSRRLPMLAGVKANAFYKTTFKGEAA